MQSFEFHSRSEEETAGFGRRLASALQPGLVVGLIGDLGAGKTRLVQAICEGLGIDRESVTSPTFVLIQEYHGRLPVYHIDTYRLGDLDEFLELGAEELFDGDGVCFIEWADRVAEILPTDSLRIEITAIAESQRRIVLTAEGAKSINAIEELNLNDQ